jgi:hypothetical protein
LRVQRRILSAWVPPTAKTILRYVDRQGRPDRQVDVCDIHTTALCADLKVIDRGRRSA